MREWFVPGSLGLQLLQMAILCGATYFVYRDAYRREVPYKNCWVAGTFLFLPVLLFYLWYRHKSAREVSVSVEQHAQYELERKQAAEKRSIAAQRAQLEQARQAELERHRVTEAELERLQEARKVAKAKRMQELAAERAEQEKRHAALLKLKEKKLQDTVARNLKVAP